MSTLDPETLLAIIGALMAIVGTLGLTLWNNQQAVMRNTNIRLDKMQDVLVKLSENMAALTAIQQTNDKMRR